MREKPAPIEQPAHITIEENADSLRILIDYLIDPAALRRENIRWTLFGFGLIALALYSLYTGFRSDTGVIVLSFLCSLPMAGFGLFMSVGSLKLKEATTSGSGVMAGSTVNEVR